VSDCLTLCFGRLSGALCLPVDPDHDSLSHVGGTVPPTDTIESYPSERKVTRRQRED
jgi:hypothetical protein